MAKKNVDFAFVLRVLALFDGFRGLSNDDIWWRTDAPEYNPITLFVNCNDLFYWGVADCEEVTPENVELLEKTIKDVEKATKRRRFADLLFAARVRGSRPQNAYYRYLPEELWPLFDACGPQRAIDVGNPDPDPRSHDGKNAA